MPPTDDPVADLVAIGTGYRRYAIERPHMYRLMFGSTSAHGINAPAENVLALTIADIERRYPSFAQLVLAVQRSMLAGRITVGTAHDDAAVVATAAQVWALIHGFVMLELAGYYGADGAAVGPVLAAMTSNLLVALGDSPERVRQNVLTLTVAEYRAALPQLRAAGARGAPIDAGGPHHGWRRR